MKASELAAKVKQAAAKEATHSFLLYGESKTGKTALAATLAKVPDINRVFWFDLENGSDTLFSDHVGLQPEHLEKIEIFKIQDTKQQPLAILTVGKALTSAAGISLCDEHGRVDCPDCTKAKKPFSKFKLPDLTPRDVVVIDSGTQLGASAEAFITKDKPVEYKCSFNDYGEQGRLLHNILSTVQQATFCKFVVISHVISIGEGEDNKNAKDYPQIGTRNFSRNVAKYFGTVVYLERKMKQHKAGSSTIYSSLCLTGSRWELKFEDFKKLDFEEIFKARETVKS